MSNPLDTTHAAPADPRIAVLLASQRDFVRFVETRVGDPELAHDLVQAAFVRGLEKASQVRDDESVVAWFYRILRNAIIDHHRRAAVADRRLERAAHELAGAPEPPPDDRAAICRCLTGLLDTLTPSHAEALRRIDLDGLAVRAFADEIGITPNNAAVRVFRARRALREQLQRCCGACAEHGCLDCTCHGR
jgi:RNA polymerase sigma factor (sigma-70 family)